MRRRQRTALNEAVHELRRPLQALALAEPAGSESSLRLAATALERLDREINGAAAVVVREELAVGELLMEAAVRWRGVAEAAGKRLVLRPVVAVRPLGSAGSGSAPGDRDSLLVSADPFALAQALDNLIANAIEHGGPRIVLATTPLADAVRISVRDFARPLATTRASRPRAARTPLGARLFGAARRGHGLRVVRRIAAAHDGRFELRCSSGGAEAILELSLADSTRQGVSNSPKVDAGGDA